MSGFKFTPEELRLLRATIAPNATNDEFALFVYRCEALDLNPLKSNQIHFVKYGNNPGTIVIGIDGFRARAARSGKLSGIKRGEILDDKGALVGAWAEVYRADWKEPAREEARLSEYDTNRAMWAKMKSTMIKKVAESAALRMAFPDELGGIYTNEEMSQAEPVASVGVQPGSPGPDDGIQPPLPSCDGCKAELKRTMKKSGRFPNGCWFCPNWQDSAVKHIEPVSPEEHEKWRQEIVLYTIEQATKAEAEERGEDVCGNEQVTNMGQLNKN